MIRLILLILLILFCISIYRNGPSYTGYLIGNQISTFIDGFNQAVKH